jgi:hypothetical protein
MSSVANSTQHNLATFGQLGSVAVAGEDGVTVPEGKSIIAITALAATSLTNLASGGESLTGAVNLPAGVTIYGKWSAATVGASGSVIAYFG